MVIYSRKILKKFRSSIDVDKPSSNFSLRGNYKFDIQKINSPSRLSINLFINKFLDKSE